MEKGVLLLSLQRSMEETLSQKERLVQNADEAVADIERRADFLHAMVDEVKEEVRETVVSMKEEELNRIANHVIEIQQYINFLNAQNAYITNCRKCQNQPFNGFKLCDQCEDEMGRIKKLSEFENVCLHFKPSSVTKTDMTSVYGSVEDYRITKPSSITKEPPPLTTPTFAVDLVSEFTSSESSTNVHAILPVSESEAWVCCGWGSDEIHFYNTSGEKKVSLTLDIQVDHMDLTSSGDVLVTSYKGNLILRVNKDLQVSTFAELDVSPKGLFVASNDEVYVCGSERLCSSKDETTSKSKENRHVIQKLSKNGEVLSEIDVSPHEARRIAVDDEGNIYFTSYSGDKNRQFVILSADETTKLTYTGPLHAELENQFYPLGVCRDRFGYILISDWNNDNIHLLNKDGQFVRFLLTNKHGIEAPNALAIDREGQLWVGNGIGEIKVYKYVV